ncbi:uncharacterized protein ZBAI_02303 [Zygosaccharomyces bailii ISA1307]|nr:uncharacterized protein ZBAI_02303 [Zygosaccharomyces bailii ISA1307]
MLEEEKEGKNCRVSNIYRESFYYFAEHYSIPFQLKGELLVTYISNTREDELPPLEPSNWSKRKKVQCIWGFVPPPNGPQQQNQAKIGFSCNIPKRFQLTFLMPLVNLLA